MKVSVLGMVFVLAVAGCTNDQHKATTSEQPSYQRSSEAEWRAGQPLRDLEQRLAEQRAADQRSADRQEYERRADEQFRSREEEATRGYDDAMSRLAGERKR